MDFLPNFHFTPFGVVKVTDLEREHQELGNTLRTAHLKFENFEKSLQRQRLEVESKKRELSVTECAETFYSNFLKRKSESLPSFMLSILLRLDELHDLRFGE